MILKLIIKLYKIMQLETIIIQDFEKSILILENK
jgi:hypothetical protein